MEGVGRLVRPARPAGGQDRLPSPTSIGIGSRTVIRVAHRVLEI